MLTCFSPGPAARPQPTAVRHASRAIAVVWLVVCGCLGLGFSTASRADDTLDAWRAQAGQVRVLAENDTPNAHAQAQQLQAKLPRSATPMDRVRILNLLSRIELYLAQTEASAQHAQQALDLAAHNGDAVGQAEAQLTITLNAINEGKVQASIAATTRSLDLLEGVDRPDLLGEALLRMSMMYRRLGDWDSSITMAIQSLEIAKRSRDPLAMTYAHQGMAVSLEQSGSLTGAREQYTLMRDQASAAHSRILEGQAIRGLAGVVSNLGDPVEAEVLMREAVNIFRPLQIPFYLNHVLFGLADVLHKQGHHAEAVQVLNEVVTSYERYPNKIGLWWSLYARSENYQSLGNVLAARADAERAYALAKAIDFSYYRSESAKRKALIAEAAGDHRQAYQLSVEATDMADKATRERTSTRMVELAQRYETESKQREINALTLRNAQQTAELRQRELQQRWLWTLLGGGWLVFAGTAYFLFHVRRANRKLQALNTEVQRSQNKLQATLDAMPDLLFELGLDGRYYDVHPPNSELLAAPAEVLIGKTVSDFMSAEAASVNLSALREAHETGTSFGKQLELKLPHGTFWFELSIARKLVVAGQEPRFIGLSRDITERKQMERSLEESRQLLRQLAARNEAAREDERRHLKRELHDELGQYLSALRMGISVMELEFGADNAILREKSSRLVDMVDSTIKVVRNVVTALRPTALDMGVVAALEWLAGDYSERTGIQCELHLCGDDIQLDDKRATAIFRIVQESLTNVVRHAHATQVDITLERKTVYFLLEVRDNGRGFDPSLRKEKSFGLVGIRERALLLGGEVEISGTPGRTAVRLHFPVRHEPMNVVEI